MKYGLRAANGRAAGDPALLGRATPQPCAVSDARTNAELTEASTSGLRWVGVARVVGELVMLGSMVVLARLIPPSAFGMFAIAVIVQELATTIPSEGVGTALVQRKTVDRVHLQAGLALALLLGAALAAVTLVVASVVVEPLFGAATATLVAVSTGWFALGALTATPIAVLRRRLDFRRLSLLDVTNTLVRSTTSIVLAAVVGLDAAALVIGSLAGVAAMCVLALIFAPVPCPRWNRKAARELLTYGGPASLASVCWAGFRNGDYAIVGAKLGATSAGVYWRGFQLAVEYQRKISTIMNQVAFPILARTAGAEEMLELRRRMVRLLTVTVFPLLVGLVVLAPVVVPWIFGPAWTEAVLPTQLLAGAGAATVVIDAVGSVLHGDGPRAGAARLRRRPLRRLHRRRPVRLQLGRRPAWRSRPSRRAPRVRRRRLPDAAARAVGEHAAVPLAGRLGRHASRARRWPRRRAGRAGAAQCRRARCSSTWSASAPPAAPPTSLALRLGFHDAWSDLSALFRRVLPRPASAPWSGGCPRSPAAPSPSARLARGSRARPRAFIA